MFTIPCVKGCTHDFIDYPFTSIDILKVDICIDTINVFIGINALIISFLIEGDWFLALNHYKKHYLWETRLSVNSMTQPAHIETYHTIFFVM